MKPIGSPLCIFFVVFAGCGDGSQSKVPEIGDAAPSFELMEVGTNRPFASTSLSGKSAVVLNFWSTTCINCLKEIEELQQIHADGKAAVVGIALDGTPEQLKKIAGARGIDYSILSGNEEIFTKYDGYSIPYTLVLDSKLVIRKKIYGRLDKDEFEQLLDSIRSTDP